LSKASLRLSSAEIQSGARWHERVLDPRDRVDPTRLDAAFYVERELPTEEQILGLID
jgi:hypothetical protein